MGLWISGGMGHGDFQAPLELVFSQFILRVVIIAFKYRLHREKFNLIVVFKGLRYFLKSWEPHPAASGSPVLKKIQINHLAPVIPLN